MSKLTLPPSVTQVKTNCSPLRIDALISAPSSGCKVSDISSLRKGTSLFDTADAKVGTTCDTVAVLAGRVAVETAGRSADAVPELGASAVSPMALPIPVG